MLMIKGRRGAILNLQTPGASRGSSKILTPRDYGLHRTLISHRRRQRAAPSRGDAAWATCREAAPYIAADEER